MCDEKETSVTVKLREVLGMKIDEFKNLGSRRRQYRWGGDVSDVICDRRIVIRVKRKLRMMMVRAPKVCGLETVALAKRKPS